MFRRVCPVTHSVTINDLYTTNCLIHSYADDSIFHYSVSSSKRLPAGLTRQDAAQRSTSLLATKLFIFLCNTRASPAPNTLVLLNSKYELETSRHISSLSPRGWALSIAFASSFTPHACHPYTRTIIRPQGSMPLTCVGGGEEVLQILFSWTESNPRLFDSSSPPPIIGSLLPLQFRRHVASLSSIGIFSLNSSELANSILPPSQGLTTRCFLLKLISILSKFPTHELTSIFTISSLTLVNSGTIFLPLNLVNIGTISLSVYFILPLTRIRSRGEYQDTSPEIDLSLSHS